MIRLAHPLLLIVLVAVIAAWLLSGRRRALAPRAVALILVALALAGPEIGGERLSETVLFLVDRSPSVTRTTTPEDAENAMSAIVSANPSPIYGAVAFAERAVSAAPARMESPSLEDVAALGAATNLAAAVALALAALPADRPGQLVLLSDGRITDDPIETVGLARRRGVPISVVPLGSEARMDAAIVSLEVPAEVATNRPFAIDVVISTASGGPAMLVLYRDTTPLSARDLVLNAGLSRVRLTDTLDVPGTVRYRARIQRDGDPIPENDGLSALVRTTVSPDLLVVSRDASPVVTEQLDALGIRYRTGHSVPALEELSGIKRILLTGVPIAGILPSDIDTLRSFVSDLGGSLLVVEGEEALRGYAGGCFEELLPVSYVLPQHGREASLCIVFLLDRSASMRGRAGGASKIEILKESAAASINLLDEDTLVGLVAFDREFDWIVPIQTIGDGATIYERLAEIEALGGTDIYFPIVDALDALEDVEARVRHLLLLSDGKTIDEYRDFQGLLGRLASQDRIALSSVAIGPTPNLPLITRLVEAGGGTVYRASTFQALPQISMQATQRLSRSRFVTGEVPVTGSLASGELASIPPIGGYALTYRKPTAEVLLWAHEDPLLARWRLGLGTVAVLNTDLAGRWSEEWLAWSKGALLVDTVLASAGAGRTAAQGFTVSVDGSDGGLVALVDARDAQGAYLNFLNLEARLLPDEAGVPMDQVGAGLYRADLGSRPEGGYALAVRSPADGREAILPVSVPYAREYDGTGIDESALRRIADATGGRLMEDEILPPPAPGSETFSFVQVHPHLLIAALVLFLGELVARKLPRLLRRQAASG